MFISNKAHCKSIVIKFKNKIILQEFTKKVFNGHKELRELREFKYFNKIKELKDFRELKEFKEKEVNCS